MISSRATWLLPQATAAVAEIQVLAPSAFDGLVEDTITMAVVFSLPVVGDQIIAIVSDDETVALPQQASVTVLDGQQTADVLVDLLRLGSATITATHATGVKQSSLTVVPAEFGPAVCEDGPIGESAFELVPKGLSAERID